MDWARAIERNSEALKGIVAALFALLGLHGGGAPARIPRALHTSVLRLLRPAESALRRLIVIAARGLDLKLPPARPRPAGLSGRGGGKRLAFQLFDRRKRFAALRRRSATRLTPRIHLFASDPRVAALWSTPDPAPEPDGLLDAQPLFRRLEALERALADVPRQARRLARWRARREKMPSPKFTSPLRPGPPPGHRRTPVHDVDFVLAECHGLAFDAMAPDTS